MALHSCLLCYFSLVLLLIHLSEEGFCRRYQCLPVVNTAECTPSPSCDLKSKYRPIDGSCSNLKHSHWGQAGTPFIRFLSALYDDDKDRPRRSVKGGPLPNVRQISAHLYRDCTIPDCYNTIVVMHFGQFCAHDITHITNRQEENATPGSTQCCTDDNKVPPPDTLPDVCEPIKVSSYDKFYSQFKVNCLPFTRAGLVNNGTCHKHSTEQMNKITHLLDASMIYGSDDITASELRTLSGGKLKVVTTKDGRTFLPDATNASIPCVTTPTEKKCDFAGDDRVDQNPGIVLLTTLFVRFHNYLCDKLHRINRHWDDEKLYQESRRIVIALVQHITYNEYLPIILGKSYMHRKGLSVNTCHHCCINYYNPDVNPSTFNEFGGAAFRSFHSTVPEKFVLVNENFSRNKTLILDEYFLRPTWITKPKNMDKGLRTLANQRQESQDMYFTKAVTNKLFRFDKPWGNDLESTDIIRGRDLGMPTYNMVRHLCGLKKAKHFEDFHDVMSKKAAFTLKSIYCHVDDVDLFVGGMMENLMPGTLVGPTFQCIIGEQFYHYMRGDRFYYANCGLPWSFNKAQLDAIRRTSLASIMCKGGDNLHSIQFNTFQKPSKKNPIVPCSEIPYLDLGAWKE